MPDLSPPTSGHLPHQPVGAAYIQVLDASTNEMIDIVGRILTGPNGTIRISEHLRSLVLLSENGELLISRSHRNDPHVLSFLSRIKQQGQPVQRTYNVDMKTISDAYAMSENDAAAPLATDETANTRELLRIIRIADQEGASDIHLVVEPERAIVRMRIDGVLRDIEELTAARGHDLCGTAFSMADTADSSYAPYDPQQARISQQSADLPRSIQSIRVQWNPIAFGGRHMVMRLLSTGKHRRTVSPTASNTLQAYGYRPDQMELLEIIRSRPMGMNVIAGPVNSGKSTTVAALLNALLYESRYEKSCLTVEDPPEYIVYGAQQIPITNAKTSEDKAEKYQQAIEAALRSDPNILLIGEVRGPESAALAFAGAMTGTQVWTSLHASTAIGIIDRLRDIGVEDYKLCDASILTGLIGQRLLRVLCDGCKVPLDAAEQAGLIDPPRVARTRRILAEIGHAGHEVFCRGEGCDDCKGSGYAGRTAVAEILHPDDTFMDMIRARDKKAARGYWLEQQGGYTMLTHALHKLLAGKVGPAEIEASVEILEADRHTIRHFQSLHDNA